MKRARQLDAEIAEALRVPPVREKYKLAKAVVDGRIVRSSIPNRSSITSSLDRYEVLPGVREVPFAAFDQLGPLSYYSVSKEKRTKNLAAQIRASHRPA